MKLLLDTHTLLWFIANDPKLSPVARKLVEDGDNVLFVSIATVWEIAIKNGLGKLVLAEPIEIEIFLPNQLRTNRIDVLPITQEHAFLAGKLPLHHRDPFDRMLIAQSLIESIAVVTADSAFDVPRAHPLLVTKHEMHVITDAHTAMAVAFGYFVVGFLLIVVGVKKVFLPINIR